MRKRTCLAKDLSLQTRLIELPTKGAIGAREGQLTLHELKHIFVLIGITEEGGECYGSELIMGTKPATIMNNERLVAQLQRIAQETSEIFHTCRCWFCFRINPIADSIKQSSGLGVRAMLKHTLGYKIYAAIETINAVSTFGSWGKNELAICYIQPLCAESSFHFVSHTVSTFIENAIARESKIPWIPMGFALNRIF